MSFQDEMHVIGLHRKVNDPERGMRGSDEVTAELGKHELAPQARKTALGAERDVNGMVLAVIRPRSVGNSGTPGGPLTTGACSLAAPGT